MNKKWIKPALIVVASVTAYVLLAKDKGQVWEEDYSWSSNQAGTKPSEPMINGRSVSDLAQTLHNAMKYSGTEEKIIFQTLESIDQQAFGKIFKRFGKRAYNQYLGNQTRINPFSELPKLSLKEWFKHELSATEYETLRLKYPHYL